MTFTTSPLCVCVLLSFCLVNGERVIARSSNNVSSASYYLQDNFSGSTFFDNFVFETMNDPTNGYVDFVDKDSAFNSGMAQLWNNGQVYMGVDYTNVVPDGSRGRKAIRITSNRAYNGNNLIVIDAEHMPSSAGSLPNGCSLWPAFWMCGPDWPNNGEIDIIEYANNQVTDLTTLHTSNGCDQDSEDTSLFTGTWATGADGVTASSDCSVYAADQYSNQGCGIYGDNRQPVGDAFNGQKGGVYAVEWTVDNYIRAFYFPRSSIPQNLLDNVPQPDTWGTPYARFELGDAVCPSQHFKNNQIVFDTTFCGDWAGATFPSTCTTSVSCTDYVKYNPADFQEAFWLLNYVKVFNKA